MDEMKRQLLILEVIDGTQRDVREVARQVRPLLENGYRVVVRASDLRFETVEDLVRALEKVIARLKRDEQGRRRPRIKVRMPEK